MWAHFGHFGLLLTGDKIMKFIKAVDDVIFFSVMGTVIGIGVAYAVSKILLEKVNPMKGKEKAY